MPAADPPEVLDSDPSLGEVGLYPGRVIGGKYRLLAHLGTGGMGTVFAAEHVELGKRFALKFLRADATSKPNAIKRFEREAQLLAKLTHENVVSLIDVGFDSNGPSYLVLEFISGRTLRSELKLGPLTTDRMLALVTQVARGLAAAHEAGMIHRDLKPENIMLTEHADGRPLVKLLDFGVARPYESNTDTLTLTGQAMGTAAYMSPEQARGEHDVDARSDVYALGVIVYESLAGVRPYDGSSYNETLFRILNQQHVSLSSLRPDLPAKVDDVIDRALAKYARERFDSPSAFVSALHQLLRGTRVRTSWIGEDTADAPSLSGTLSAAFLSHDALSSLDYRVPRAGTHWTWAALAAGAGLLIGGTGVWLFQPQAGLGGAAEAAAVLESPAPDPVTITTPAVVEGAPPSGLAATAPASEPAPTEAPASNDSEVRQVQARPVATRERAASKRPSSHPAALVPAPPPTAWGNAASPRASSPPTSHTTAPSTPPTQSPPPSLLGGDYGESPYSSGSN